MKKMTESHSPLTPADGASAAAELNRRGDLVEFDIKAKLPVLVPRAITWAEAREHEALKDGNPLTLEGLALALSVGVARPELVRIAVVKTLPLPDDPELRFAALQTGLLGPNMVGLTLGCAVFICHGHENARVLSHELRHVHQYETAGSIADYLPVYIQQIVELGYWNAPFEIDARAREIAA